MVKNIYIMRSAATVELFISFIVMLSTDYSSRISVQGSSEQARSIKRNAMLLTTNLVHLAGLLAVYTFD